MGRITIGLLKLVIALSLAGSLLVQTVLLPLGWIDLTEGGVPVATRVGVVTTIGLGIVCLQVFAVCVWRLLTLVRRGSVFSETSFSYVDVIIWCFAAAAVLALTLAVAVAPGNVAPGVVGLICGVALVLSGLCLLMVVMRRLLSQAIERDREARTLRAELDEVI